MRPHPGVAPPTPARPCVLVRQHNRVGVCHNGCYKIGCEYARTACYASIAIMLLLVLSRSSQLAHLFRTQTSQHVTDVLLWAVQASAQPAALGGNSGYTHSRCVPTTPSYKLTQGGPASGLASQCLQGLSPAGPTCGACTSIWATLLLA